MSVESRPPTYNNKYSALINAESKRSRRYWFRDVTTLGRHRLACLSTASQTVADRGRGADTGPLAAASFRAGAGDSSTSFVSRTNRDNRSAAYYVTVNSANYGVQIACPDDRRQNAGAERQGEARPSVPSSAIREQVLVTRK